MLTSWVNVSTGTATRKPNKAVKTGSSRTPPPKPATAETNANPNAASDANTTLITTPDTFHGHSPPTHIAEGQPHPNGTLVDQRIYAPYHQHFIVARMDLDIDGTDNTVYRSETQIQPTGPDNPHGLGLVQVNTRSRPRASTTLTGTPSALGGWSRELSQRSRHGQGLQAGTGRGDPVLLRAGSPVPERAQVIGHTVWVTPTTRPNAGRAASSSTRARSTTGCRSGSRPARPVRNTDVVVWYVFGIHHITRPEEWPIMSVDAVSFWLKPSGFFDRNPALDVAPSPGAHCAPGHDHGASTDEGHDSGGLVHDH